MFEKFTERSRRVIVLAQEGARSLNHHYIGTEHLLLGLLAEEEGLGSRALRRAGLDHAAALAAVERLVPPGTGAPSGHIPFTPRAKTSLEQALTVSLRYEQSFVGTEHLLLGLLHDSQGVGPRVIAEFVPLDDLRREVLALVEESAPAPSGLSPYEASDGDSAADRGRRQATIAVGDGTVVLTFRDEDLLALARTRIPTEAQSVAFLDGPTGAAIERAWTATHEALQALPPWDKT